MSGVGVEEEPEVVVVEVAFVELSELEREGLFVGEGAVGVDFEEVDGAGVGEDQDLRFVGGEGGRGDVEGEQTRV